eukprot:gene23364-31703_t
MSSNLRMSISVPEAANQAPEDLSKTVGFSIHSSTTANNRMYLKTSDTESSHLPNVRKRYNDLHTILKQLSNKLTDLSASVDQEFLSSYRVHMLSIQMEIKDLKMEVEKGEAALKSDGTVAKLETEVKWFIDECNRLKVHCSSMESDCKQLKDRLDALKEQKVFLSEQLKAIMKRNRVLQAEIGYATKKTDSSQEFNEKEFSKSSDPKLKSTTNLNSVEDRHRGTTAKENSVRRAARQSISTPNLIQRSPSRQGGAMSALGKSRSLPKLDKATEMLKDRNELENFLRSKSKYEYQLERTVLDIFREIKERKNAALKTSFRK